MLRLSRSLVLLLIVVGCHAQQSGKARGGRRDVITQEEIEASNATNVYDLIASLRGEYLKDRGKISIKTNTREQAVVFLNEQEYGILSTMRNIPTGRISEVRYITGIDAVNRFGAQYGGGIIMLVSRNQ
jgi:outer membrane cobalamin receptor